MEGPPSARLLFLLLRNRQICSVGASGPPLACAQEGPELPWSPPAHSRRCRGGGGPDPDKGLAQRSTLATAVTEAYPALSSVTFLMLGPSSVTCGEGMALIGQTGPGAPPSPPSHYRMPQCFMCLDSSSRQGIHLSVQGSVHPFTRLGYHCSRAWAGTAVHKETNPWPSRGRHSHRVRESKPGTMSGWW